MKYKIKRVKMMSSTHMLETKVMVAQMSQTQRLINLLHLVSLLFLCWSVYCMVWATSSYFLS